MAQSHHTLTWQLVLIGLAEFNVDEWEACTIYKTYTKTAKQVVWFWEVGPAVCPPLLLPSLPFPTLFVE